jgi:hypothetical protein
MDSTTNPHTNPAEQVSQKYSSSLLGCHQEFLLDNLRGRRALGCEDELEVANDLIDDLIVFDKGDDPHLASAAR